MEELEFGLEQCADGQADNGGGAVGGVGEDVGDGWFDRIGLQYKDIRGGTEHLSRVSLLAPVPTGIPLLKDVDVSKVASSSKLNAQAPVFKPPQQVLASMLPGTSSPVQPSEGAKSTTASPSSSSETTTSFADAARHVVLKAACEHSQTPCSADNQMSAGRTVVKGDQASQLGFQNLDPSIVTFVCESLIVASNSDGVQQTTTQSQNNGSIEFLYELGSSSRSNSLSKGSARSSQAPSKLPPSSSTFSGGGSPTGGQLALDSSSPSPAGGTKTPPLPTSGTKTPPSTTSGTKTPPSTTNGTKTVSLTTKPAPPCAGVVPVLPTNGTKPPASTASGVNPQGVVDPTVGGQPPSAADSSVKPPAVAPPVTASAWSRPKDWGTVFGGGGSPAGGGGPRLLEKPNESTSPPESGIADMHEGAEDRSSEGSNPLLVQLGGKQPYSVYILYV